MTNQIIEDYKKELDLLRNNASEFEKYRFHLDEVTHRDINQHNRFTIGIGLFNDLRVPDDYGLVEKLLEEEIKHRNSQSINYNYEVIYMYFYFLSEFDNIEDIWKFASFKFDGTMDSDSGFETEFFLTYGKEKLMTYLKQANHALKEQILKKVRDMDDEDGERYREGQVAYFGLKAPIQNPLNFYQFIQHKTLFERVYKSWKSTIDLNDARNAYDNIHYAEFLGDEESIQAAIIQYYKTEPSDWLAKEYFQKLPFKVRCQYHFQKIKSRLQLA